MNVNLNDAIYKDIGSEIHWPHPRSDGHVEYVGDNLVAVICQYAATGAAL